MVGCKASRFPEDDKSRNTFLVTPSIGISTQGLGTCNVSPLAKTTIVATPCSSPPLYAQYRRVRALVTLPPLANALWGMTPPPPYDGILLPGSGARGAPDLSEGQIIHRTVSHAAPSAHSSEASIMSGRSSPDVKVALRCGYGNPRCKGSLLALRSTSACKTGRNLPLSVIDEECLDLTTPDVPSHQRNAKGFSPATDVPPAADGRVGNVSPPQGSTAATPCARNRGTLVTEGTRSGGTDKETPPAPPTVLTTPLFVDALETPSAQAEDVSPTLFRRTGQERPAASRN